jgi:SAM-dependent methyltransferase
MGNAEQDTSAGKLVGAVEFDDPTSALVYDLTQPCVIDLGCFVEAIVGEIRFLRSRCILDLGCGTGLQALPILERLEAIEYMGIDRSAAMVSIFERKLDERQMLGTGIQLRAGLDLRNRAAVETLVPLVGGAVLMSQFLQYLPVEPTPDILSKFEMLRRTVDLAGQGGRVFIIEDVMDEDDGVHARGSREWDQAVLSHYRENLDRLRGSLGHVAPRYLDAIGMLLQRPALMPAMRERRRRTRGETILPHSMWRRMLDELDRPFRMVPHRELGNFYLTIIEC